MAKRVKNNFVFSEEFKKELLATLFDNYGTGTDVMGRNVYIGYCGCVPLEVSFMDYGIMDIGRLDKLHRGGSRKKLMCEILSSVFGREISEDVENRSEEYFTKDLNVTIFFFNHGASLVFRRKEEEEAV